MPHRNPEDICRAIHALDVDEVGLGDLGRREGYIARQLRRWHLQFEQSQQQAAAAGIGRPAPMVNEVHNILVTRIPEQHETAIVHGDYRLDNVMFHPTEPKILAVLDWELSTLGHPLADFSYHCMSWHIAPGAFRGIAGLDHATLGIPSEADYIASYCKRTGRAGIAHWDFYLAFGLFRIAAILQGIAKRALEGTAASAQAVETGKRARPMAEMGWSHAERVLHQPVSSR